MPGVKGQVLSVPALHASMSMLSFDPAARTAGWLASTASAGSFCLFCENGVDGLPTETRVSGLSAKATPTIAPTASAAANKVARNVLIGSPFRVGCRPEAYDKSCG